MKYRIITAAPRYAFKYEIQELDGDIWRWVSFCDTEEQGEKYIERMIQSQGFVPQVIKEYGVAI